MDLQLKKAIIIWLMDNVNQWQRVNSCVNHFRPYIYNSEGNFLIGGDRVYEFIVNADMLLFKD